MNIMCIFAGVVGVARDRNRNTFSACSIKKVAHHCFRQNKLQKEYFVLRCSKICFNVIIYKYGNKFNDTWQFRCETETKYGSHV